MITYTIRRRTVHGRRRLCSVCRAPLACKDMLTCRRSAQARKNAMAPTARSAPLEKIERLAETRERQIPCSVWASAWAPKTKKMRLLEIRRAHPLNHREPLVHTFAYQTVLFKITSDRSCCRAETPRAHPEVLSSRDAPFGGWNLSEEYRLHMTREQQGVLFLV